MPKITGKNKVSNVGIEASADLRCLRLLVAIRVGAKEDNFKISKRDRELG
jgi:hypothetical protein